MNEREEYQALAWFVAGYLEASDPPLTPRKGQRWAPDRDQIETALTEAERAIGKHGNGVCLSCGVKGAVIIDGYFCERCGPGIEQAVDKS